MYNPKQQRWGVWMSEPQSREVSKGLKRGDLLLDLGLIVAGHLETCETQLKEDEKIFANYEAEIDSLNTIIVNDSLMFVSYDTQIDGHIAETKSQKRQKWGMTGIVAILTYLLLFGN